MIRTVTGDINVSDIKNVFTHEHIGCISNDMLHVFGQDWVDKEKLSGFASEVLKKIHKKWNVNLFVDGTPIDLGRDVRLLESVSEKSGSYIVASTGLYHFPSLYTCGHSEKEIASWFIKECESGMEGTGIKPGILKAATDIYGITPDNKKRLTAMAITQKETNLPIYVHSNHSAGLADEQLEILMEHIVNPEKIIIGHTALKPKADYLEKFLDKGCYICMDQCHCTNYSIDEIGKTLAELCKKGYTDKIVLSNDICIYSDFGSRRNTGLHLTTEEQAENFGHIFNYVYESFLENGGKAENFEMMVKDNAINFLNI